MAKNTGKVKEKSGNFVSLEKWEPCLKIHLLEFSQNASAEFSKFNNKNICHYSKRAASYMRDWDATTLPA